MKVADLFCGVGGLSQGFVWAGCIIVEGACSAVVDKIQPAFRGVQEVQVHVARHRIFFAICA